MLGNGQRPRAAGFHVKRHERDCFKQATLRYLRHCRRSNLGCVRGVRSTAVELALWFDWYGRAGSCFRFSRQRNCSTLANGSSYESSSCDGAFRWKSGFATTSLDLMRTLAALFSLAVGGVAALAEQPADPPRSGDGLFALPLECPSKSVCTLLGQVRKGHVVTLLSSKDGATCRPKVGRSSQVEDDVSDPHYLTRLDLGRCPGFPFKLAWLGDPKAKYAVGPFQAAQNSGCQATRNSGAAHAVAGA